MSIPVRTQPLRTDSTRVARPLLLALVAILCACSVGDEGVTISGDIPGLDTLGFRGDSLIARAERMPETLDSLRLATGADSGTATDSARRRARMAAGATSPGANPMSIRAQARGDSMARAAAARLVGASSTGARSMSDTVRGTITLTGPAQAKSAAMRLPSGSIMALSGLATSGMTRLEGAEIVARGMKVSPRDMVVSTFVVRTMKGVPAFDGRLESTGDGWSLRLTDGTGRKRLTSVPATLQSAAGARVWISYRDGASTPEGYGLILRR